MIEGFINIEDGRVTQGDALKTAIRALPTGRYSFKLQRKDKRSLPQNAYLHGCMLPLIRDVLREAGWNNIRTVEDAKDFVKVKFLTCELVNEQTGEVITMFRKTSELSKQQFSELVEDVAVWLWDTFETTLPLPNTQTELFTT